MKFRTLDSNWDWKFGTGNSDFANNSLATAYDIKTQILSWYGDCFFAMQDGIDWKNILGTKDQKKTLDTAIKQILVTQEDVIEISYFDSEITNRQYHCTARVKTIYNETIEVKI